MTLEELQAAKETLDVRLQQARRAGLTIIAQDIYRNLQIVERQIIYLLSKENTYVR